MKLSQSVTYALQATLRLAEMSQQRPVSCNQLASDGNMPERFLLQILRDLSKQQILQSTRGGGGGFMLDRTPEEISLLQIIEAIDGPIASGLPAKISFPGDTDRHVRAALDEITRNVCARLAEIKLSDLLEPVPIEER